MLRLRSLAYAAGLALSLSGCVAAVIPLVAAGAVGAKVIRGSAVTSVSDYEAGTDGSAKRSTASLTVSKKAKASASAQLAQIAANYRESASASAPEYLDFLRFSLGQAEKYDTGEAVRSVVMVPGGSPEKREFFTCNSLPLAVMIDLDRNGDGVPASMSGNSGQTDLAKSLAALRNTGLTVIWLSDRPATDAPQLISALKSSGLMEEGDNDFLSLDRGKDDRKQERRIEASERFCIVAMTGDRKSDFDELFDYLRNPDTFVSLDTMWGAGWFLKPVPDITATAPSVSDQLTLQNKDK